MTRRYRIPDARSFGLRRRWGNALSVAALLGMALWPEIAKSETVRIDCPSRWPGPDEPRAVLTNVGFWDTMFADLLTQPERFPNGEVRYRVDMSDDDKGRLYLVCKYANGRQAIYPIPGLPQHCTIGLGRANRAEGIFGKEQGCSTVVENPEQARGLRPHIVERISLATTIHGFGLRMTGAEVEALATKDGWSATLATVSDDSSTAGMRLDFRRNGERLEIRFSATTGSVREIVEFGPRTGSDLGAFYVRRAALRFGTPGFAGFSDSNKKGVYEYWRGADGIRIERYEGKHRADSLQTIHLIDLKAE